MKNNFKAIMCFIGAMFLFFGAAFADSDTVIPTFICMVIGLVLVAPTIVAELKESFR